MSKSQTRVQSRAWSYDGHRRSVTARRLGSGMYLATSLGLWNFSWVALAIPTLIVVGVAGGLTAPARKRVRETLAAQTGGLPHDVQPS